MAEVRDFFSRLGKESTASIAYLLLMANVLGIAVYFDGKKNVKTCTREPKNAIQKETLTPSLTFATNDKTTNQTAKPASIVNDKETISNVTNNIEQNLEDTIDKEQPQKKRVETNQVESISTKNNKEQLKTRDNIIDFKEVVASKVKETKQPLEPLVWRFPRN